MSPSLLGTKIKREKFLYFAFLYVCFYACEIVFPHVSVS